MALVAKINNALFAINKSSIQRCIHVTPAMDKCQSGRYRTTLKRTRPLTYEMAYQPCHIAHKKSWNSWNTSNIVDGNRPMESAVEDIFIRKFMMGTWFNMFLTEIIIKRHHNIIRIAGIIKRIYNKNQVYFLIGYTEQLLGYYLHCPVKIEIQTVEKNEDVIYKYI